MQIIEFDKTKLIDEVQEVLTSWQKEKLELRTVAYLSRETGVTESSIRRLLNSDIKIADDSLFKILSYISGEYKFQQFLEFFSGRNEIRKWFKRNYSFMENSDAIQDYKPSPISSIISSNPIMFSVYMLISSVDNTSVKDIKEQFGIRGEIELESLLSKGIITIENDILKAKEEKIKISKDETISLLPDLTKMFLKRDHEFNYRALEIEAVDKEGYLELCSIYERFLGNVSEVLKNRRGNIPVIVAGFFDSMTCQPYFEGRKNEKIN